MSPSQQPPAHDVGVHRHMPATHCVLPVHAGPLPQVHAPLVQVSAVCGLHAVQIAPPEPHWLGLGGVVQLPSEQHPDGQDDGVH